GGGRGTGGGRGGAGAAGSGRRAGGGVKGATPAVPGRCVSTTTGTPTRPGPHSVPSRASVVASRSGVGPGGVNRPSCAARTRSGTATTVTVTMAARRGRAPTPPLGGPRRQPGPPASDAVEAGASHDALQQRTQDEEQRLDGVERP